MQEEAKKELILLCEDQDFKFPDLYLNLAKIYLQEKEWERVLSYVEKAVALNPNLEEAYFILSIVHEKRGNLKLALEIIRKYIKENPKYSESVARRLVDLVKLENQEKNACQ
jgi:tetratricopeptide (TPR) repeat protein